MKTRYKITIEETSLESKMIGDDWKKGAGSDGGDFGYTPQKESQQIVTREIYMQNVNELDVKAVIYAVNNSDL